MSAAIECLCVYMCFCVRWVVGGDGSSGSSGVGGGNSSSNISHSGDGGETSGSGIACNGKRSSPPQTASMSAKRGRPSGSGGLGGETNSDTAAMAPVVEACE